MPWRYSLLLPIALLLLLLTALLIEPSRDVIVIRVVSAVSGEAMPGARVTVSDRQYLTDMQGEVRVERPGENVAVKADVDGFVEVDLPVRASGDLQVIQMQSALVSGFVKNEVTGDPVAGADVELRDMGGHKAESLRTDSNGAYIFKSVPREAVLHVQADGYRAASLPVGARRQVDILLRPTAPAAVLGLQVSTTGRDVVTALATSSEGGE